MKDERNQIMKRIYFQPQTQVTSIALQSVILAGSAGNTLGIDPSKETSTVF